ncbi:hypothetical protein ACN38_g12825 [Penicillium nordicum]|uniref:Uncharacterized protein n=1 Tax=Penicillium nordicum TaxID=229535 RepID=A0A0M9W9K0_9EURO|nr:hypothetical protein ACN38_g12825 [Penicillium nordicum]
MWTCHLSHALGHTPSTMATIHHGPSILPPILFNHPLQSFIHLAQPSSSINHSLRSSIHFKQLSTSLNYFNQQSTSVIHPLQPRSTIYFNHPLQSTTHFDHLSTSNNYLLQPPIYFKQLSHPFQSSNSTIELNPNQSDRGGLRLQGNRQTATTLIIQSYLDPPPRSRLPFDPPLNSIPASLAVAGFTASGQSADW